MFSFFTVFEFSGGKAGTTVIVGLSFWPLSISSCPACRPCDPFEVVFPQIVPEGCYIHCITYISISFGSSAEDTLTGISKQAMNEPQILC